MKYVEMRDVFGSKDAALDFLTAGMLFVSLREKDGFWCMTWLEPKR